MAQDMQATANQLVPIQSITWLAYQSGQELTRPLSFACNGICTIPTFLQNAGVADDGSVDFRAIAMPWDVGLFYAGSTKPLAGVYRFSWTSPLATTTSQPSNQQRQMSRTAGVQVMFTIEQYVVDDVTGLLSALSPLLSILGGKDASGAPVAPPSFDLSINVKSNSYAATT